MDYMFQNASAFDQNLNAWDVSLIPSYPTDFDTNTPLFTVDEHPVWGTDGTYTLYPLSNTTNDPTSATWRTNYAPNYVWVDNVGLYTDGALTNAARLFQNNATFNDPDVGLWDMTTITTPSPNGLTGMFQGCTSFNQDLSAWDTSNIVSMADMFKDATAFNQDISSWDVSNVTSFIDMFRDASAYNNGGAALTWSTFASNNVRMVSMFRDCPFNQDISTFDMSGVTDMQYMFDNNSVFNQDISGWDVSGVTNPDNMRYVFRNATAFDQNLNAWDVSTIPSLPLDFETNTPLFDVAEHPIWGTDGTILYPLTGEAESILDPTWISTYAPTSYVWDATPGAEGIRVKANDPITNMERMFLNGGSPGDGGVSSTFNNSDVSSWDVSTVTNMKNMFRYCPSFNQPLDSWDVSNVTNMETMFYALITGGSFNQPLNSWDVSNVTNMNNMFNNQSAFNGNISSWNVGNVTDMNSMFNGTAFNQDIGSWNVSNVTTMQGMFENASTFNQDIGS